MLRFKGLDLVGNRLSQMLAIENGLSFPNMTISKPVQVIEFIRIVWLLVKWWLALVLRNQVDLEHTVEYKGITDASKIISGKVNWFGKLEEKSKERFCVGMEPNRKGLLVEERYWDE